MNPATSSDDELKLEAEKTVIPFLKKGIAMRVKRSLVVWMILLLVVTVSAAVFMNWTNNNRVVREATVLAIETEARLLLTATADAQ